MNKSWRDACCKKLKLSDPDDDSDTAKELPHGKICIHAVLDVHKKTIGRRGRTRRRAVFTQKPRSRHTIGLTMWMKNASAAWGPAAMEATISLLDLRID